MGRTRSRSERGAVREKELTQSEGGHVSKRLLVVHLTRGARLRSGMGRVVAGEKVDNHYGGGVRDYMEKEKAYTAIERSAPYMHFFYTSVIMQGKGG